MFARIFKPGNGAAEVVATLVAGYAAEKITNSNFFNTAIYTQENPASSSNPSQQISTPRSPRRSTSPS
jgi:hypothetical protein